MCVGFTGLACVAPKPAAVPEAPTGTQAYWIITEETGQIVVDPVDSPLDGLAGAAALEWAAFADDRRPPLGPQPSVEQPRLPVPPPVAVLEFGERGFQVVEADSAAAGRLFRPCAVERLRATAISTFEGRTNLRSIVPLGAGLLLTSLPEYVSNDCLAECVRRPAEVTLISRASLVTLTHPDLEIRKPGNLLACSDQRGGAWVLDAGGNLFHARPSGEMQRLWRVELPGAATFGPTAIGCWPSPDDAEMPALFLRNFDYDVYYAPPPPGGARPTVVTARPTDVRRRRFDGIAYTKDGEPVDRLIDVGVDTSIFEAESPDTLRVQFWSRWVWTLRLTETSTAEVSSATTAPPLRVAEDLDAQWVVARSALTRTANGDEFVVGELRIPGRSFPQTRLYRRRQDSPRFVEIARDAVEASVLLSFRDLLIGARNGEGLLLEPSAESIGVCASAPLFTSPRVGAVTPDGFVVLGGTDAPPLAIELVR